MALIGVSGKLSSGKDTVGKIIQYLKYLEHLNSFNLSEEVRENLTPTFKQWIEGHESTGNPIANIAGGWHIRKFADKLKEIASMLTGIPKADFEKQEVKDSLLGDEWTIDKGLIIKNNDSRVTKEMRDAYFEHYGEELRGDVKISDPEIPTVRWLLQTLGTNAMRDKLHINVWVNALLADYKPLYKSETLAPAPGFSLKTDDIHPNWIITDMRFPNELEAIKQRGGVTIRVNRGWIDLKAFNELNKGTATYNPDFDKNTHPSETALDFAEFDYAIDNNGTIEELIEKVRQILITEKIITE